MIQTRVQRSALARQVCLTNCFVTKAFFASLIMSEFTAHCFTYTSLLITSMLTFNSVYLGFGISPVDMLNFVPHSRVGSPQACLRFSCTSTKRQESCNHAFMIMYAHRIVQASGSRGEHATSYSMARCPTKLRHGVSGTLDIRTASLFLLIPVDDAGRNPAAMCDPVAREALASFEQPDSHVCCSSRNHGVQPGQARQNNGVYMTQSGSCVLKAQPSGMSTSECPCCAANHGV